MSTRLSVLLAAALLLLGVLPGAAAAAPGPVNTTPPSVTGVARYGEVLTATAGTWSPAPAGDAYQWAYRWLRDGDPIPNATAPTYRVRLADLGHRLAVLVTATDAAGSASAVSTESARVTRAAFRERRAPQVRGTPRYGHTLRATSGRWSPAPDRVRYRWLRDGDPVAKGPRYALRPADVGHRIRVRVTVTAPGHRAVATSAAGTRVRHRTDVRRTVTYHVETRGRIRASLAAFGRLAQETYDDARGWRASGIRFRRVARGGSFTLVLAEAGAVPRFSSGCSSSWSCRVGRYVIINQDRWLHASPAWNRARGSLRGYRHMVVNHETGHWLGLGHAGCAGRGRPAPVMMQQSKSLDGCRFNPWPTAAEIRGRTPRG